MQVNNNFLSVGNANKEMTVITEYLCFHTIFIFIFIFLSYIVGEHAW